MGKIRLHLVYEKDLDLNSLHHARLYASLNNEQELFELFEVGWNPAIKIELEKLETLLPNMWPESL